MLVDKTSVLKAIVLSSIRTKLKRGHTLILYVWYKLTSYIRQILRIILVNEFQKEEKKLIVIQQCALYSIVLHNNVMSA